MINEKMFSFGLTKMHIGFDVFTERHGYSYISKLLYLGRPGGFRATLSHMRLEFNTFTYYTIFCSMIRWVMANATVSGIDRLCLAMLTPLSSHGPLKQHSIHASVPRDTNHLVSQERTRSSRFSRRSFSSLDQCLDRGFCMYMDTSSGGLDGPAERASCRGYGNGKLLCDTAPYIEASRPIIGVCAPWTHLRLSAPRRAEEINVVAVVSFLCLYLCQV